MSCAAFQIRVILRRRRLSDQSFFAPGATAFDPTAFCIAATASAQPIGGQIPPSGPVHSLVHCIGVIMSESSSTTIQSSVQTLLRLVSRAERLEALPRTGWLVCGIANPESIAAHSYMVALIALWIADHIDEAVDIERLLRMALLHDIGEAMLTDLPWPVKQFADPAALNQAEARAARTILEASGSGWLDQWQGYARRDSLEARIVKAADQIQMLAKALQYESQNRGDTSRFWAARTFDDYGILLVRAILDELQRMHVAGEWFDNDFG